MATKISAKVGRIKNLPFKTRYALNFAAACQGCKLQSLRRSIDPM